MLLVRDPSGLVHRGLGVGDGAVEVEDDGGRRVHDVASDRDAVGSIECSFEEVGGVRVVVESLDATKPDDS